MLKIVPLPCHLITLQWRHNGRDSVSNHQPHDCLLNRLFRRRSKKTSKLRVTGLCAGNSPGTGEFLAQMASYTENVSIWWRHHELDDTWKSDYHLKNIIFKLAFIQITDDYVNIGLGTKPLLELMFTVIIGNVFARILRVWLGSWLGAIRGCKPLPYLVFTQIRHITLCHFCQ